VGGRGFIPPAAKSRELLPSLACLGAQSSKGHHQNSKEIGGHPDRIRPRDRWADGEKICQISICRFGNHSLLFPAQFLSATAIVHERRGEGPKGSDARSLHTAK